MTESINRRPPPPLGDIGQAQWNSARGPIYRFLRWMVQEHSAIPGGFKNLVASLVRAGVASSAGLQSNGWAAADHVHQPQTAAPSNPTGTAAAEGTGASLMRADATIKQGIVTNKGDVLTFSTVPARLGVGADGLVLTAASGEATGLKWASAGGSATDDDARLLAWVGIAMAGRR